MASCEVIGGVFFAADELLGMEELAVRTGSDLVDHGGLQIHEHRAWNVLSRSGLREERVERVVATTDRLVARHLPIRLIPKKKKTKQKRIVSTS